MSLFNIFKVVGSGMSAQSIRMNMTASNLANADAVASSPETAYKARHPIFTVERDTLTDSGVGVRMVKVAESQADHASHYAPGHPLADKDGYIYDSNVDPLEEMADMISASRSYHNVVEILNTSKEMLMQTLRLGE